MVARQISVSRNTLRRILSGGNRLPSRRILRQIAAATHALSAERTDRRAASARVRELAKTAAQKIGVTELARRLGGDPSNLQKAIKGKRGFGLESEQALKRNFPTELSFVSHYSPIVREIAAVIPVSRKRPRI